MVVILHVSVGLIRIINFVYGKVDKNKSVLTVIIGEVRVEPRAVSKICNWDGRTLYCFNP
jgi:hypothetical protein